ncbi:MAG: PEGA domain-containing protein [Polyangiaceae bacterium]
MVGIGVGGFFYMKRSESLGDTRADSAGQAPTAVAAAPAAARGTLEISTKPEGCAIWINGDLRKEVTPAKVEGLPLGSEIQVKLTKDGLEAYRETVTLADAQPSRAIAAEMKAGSVTVELKIIPSPTLWIDGKPWKGDKNRIEGLSADEEHKIIAAANGFIPKTFVFTARRGETKVIADQLIKGNAGNFGGDVAGGDKTPPSGDPPTREAPAAAGGSAKVRVGAKGGFCNVTVNGTSYGPTPVEAVVPAGTVRVSCKPQTGATLSQAVKVGAGETGRVSFKIEAP